MSGIVLDVCAGIDWSTEVANGVSSYEQTVAAVRATGKLSQCLNSQLSGAIGGSLTARALNDLQVGTGVWEGPQNNGTAHEKPRWTHSNRGGGTRQRGATGRSSNRASVIEFSDQEEHGRH